MPLLVVDVQQLPLALVLGLAERLEPVVALVGLVMLQPLASPLPAVAVAQPTRVQELEQVEQVVLVEQVAVVVAVVESEQVRPVESPPVELAEMVECRWQSSSLTHELRCRSPL